jgi:3-hydroxybutyrate dehydrogenase
VNNAGWSTFGEIEWVSPDTYRKISEVNIFGLMRGTQLCLPMIR